MSQARPPSPAARPDPDASCETEDERDANDQRNQPALSQDQNCGNRRAPNEHLFAAERHPMTHESRDAGKDGGILAEVRENVRNLVTN